MVSGSATGGLMDMAPVAGLMSGVAGRLMVWTSMVGIVSIGRSVDRQDE